jgi:hypothetical protein
VAGKRLRPGAVEPASRRLLSRRGALQASGGGLALLLAGLAGFGSGATAATSAPAATGGWQNYPFTLFPGDSNFTFPSAEGVKAEHGFDAWFADAKLTGESGREYAFVAIIAKNRVLTSVRADFFTFALFDLRTGDYGTFTEYDYPPADLLNAPKFTAAADHLDVRFETAAGPARWTTRRTAGGALVPFGYELSLAGVDSRQRRMSLTGSCDPVNPPAAVGPDQGYIDCFGQLHTGTYFQTRPRFSGVLSWGGTTERVTGTLGHIDRQWFTKAAFSTEGITARAISHEWRSVNLSNGTDLSLWRQFDRQHRDGALAFTRSTRFTPGAPGSLGTTDYTPDIEVEYLSFVKWPNSVSTFVPALAQARYSPSAHRVRIAAWDTELTGTPTTAVPAHKLPVEYMIGPMHWAGTVRGRAVTGFGVFERTLAYYRDWELIEVLRATVTNLPSTAFTTDRVTRANLLALTAKLGDLVARHQRLPMAAAIEFEFRPAVRTLTEPARAFLITLLSDIEVAPSIFV